MSEPILAKIDGHDFRVEPLTQKIKAIYQRWVESQALDEIRGSKDSLTEEEYGDLLKDHLFKVKHGHYGFGMPISIKYLMLKEGQLELFFHCFNAHQIVDKQILSGLMSKDIEAFDLLFTQLLESSKKN